MTPWSSIDENEARQQIVSLPDRPVDRAVGEPRNQRRECIGQTWLYRQHPNQTHKKQSWKSRSSASRRIALQRAAAVRAAGIFAKEPNAPAVDGTAVEAIEVGQLIPKENYPGR